MRRDSLLYAGFIIGIGLCASAVPIGLHCWYLQEGTRTELTASLGLLLINWGFFIGFSRLNSPVARRLGPSFGLLLITAKLFVNTFTIFLFIGLQAVRTHVFVLEFFAGYSVLLMGGVLFLHWNSKRF